MQKRANLARAARAIVCVANLLAVLLAGPAVDGRGDAHCRAAIKIVVERIGQVTSAEGLPDLFGTTTAVTLTLEGTCRTASDYFKTPRPGRCGPNHLPAGPKTLRSMDKVME